MKARQRRRALLQAACGSAAGVRSGRGRRVAVRGASRCRISALALSGSESQTDLQVLPIKEGDTLTPENLRASIKALYDTGHYSYIEASAEREADGSSSLTLRVRPIFFFSTFTLLPDDLLDRPLGSYLRLPFGEKFTTSAVDRVVQDYHSVGLRRVLRGEDHAVIRIQR